MTLDPYKVLGVNYNDSQSDIKRAYRNLAKCHHPDKGGDERIIISINAAWEILGDSESRKKYDLKYKVNQYKIDELQARELRNAKATTVAKNTKNKGLSEEIAASNWIKEVYRPIDRLLGEIINPFSKELRNLSADTYDDLLMEKFCSYIESSKNKIQRIETLYTSIASPFHTRGFSLTLYHCLSQVKDAINELNRYTMGYVDNYLHDGSEMIREASNIRNCLKKEIKLFAK
tara:strand:- start:945 stop:1640 length:696 start_codon:yes stop_codon:yes gene_type:complete